MGDRQHVSYAASNDPQEIHTYSTHIVPKDDTGMCTDVAYNAIGMPTDAAHNYAGMYACGAHDDTGLVQ